MSEPNPNWPRWVVASFAKHFSTRMGGVHLHVEGMPRQTDNKREWFELRVDGPFVNEQTKGRFRLDCEINILMCLVEDTTNAYRQHDLTGIAVAAFELFVPMFQISSSYVPLTDELEPLGWMYQTKGEKERTVVSNFGKVRHDTQIIQSSIERHYRMYI